MPDVMKLKKGGARERILEKAQELFYTQGFQNTGINQIIEESGTAKASFYQYFKSKEDLAIAYLQYYESRVVNTMHRLMKKNSSVKEFIHAWSKLINRDIKYNKNFNGDPFANFAAQMQRNDHGPITEVIEKVITRMYKLFKAHVERAIKDGQIPEEKDPRTIARHILQVYQGALFMAKISGDLSYVEDLENVFNLVITG